MKKTFYKSGDVVEIPLPSGARFTGWIVYVSGYFKNAIGLLIYPGSAQFTDLPNLKPLTDVIYTSAIAAKQYKWEIVGHQEVDERAVCRTTRIVGGEVFVGDQPVRAAGSLDWEQLPRMLAKGMTVVHRELEGLVGTNSAQMPPAEPTP